VPADAEGEATGEVIHHGRPPWWLVAIVVGVLVIAVSGNFIAGYTEREEATTTTEPLRALDALLAEADHVVIARVDSVELVGDAKDPGVLADVHVVEDLSGRLDEGEPLAVYDTAFVEAWKVGEQALLFLEPDTDASRASMRDHVRVVRRGRFLLGDDLAIRPNFTIEEVRAKLQAS
jgi:hypothetical protein